MQIGQEPRVFASTFGDVRVRAFGLAGELKELPSVHPFIAGPPTDHLGVYLDTLNQVGFSPWAAPLTLSDMRQTTQVPGGGAAYMALDIPLREEDADGNGYAYVMLRMHRGIVQFDFAVDPKAPSGPAAHELRAAQLTAQVGAIPQGHVRFLVPFDVRPAQPLRPGFAAAPLMGAFEDGILHILRMKLTSWLTDDIERAAALMIAKWADRKINPNIGMKWFKLGLPAMTPNEIQALSGKKTLLFVHGIISSIDGAFGGLFQPQAAALIQQISKTYGANAIGFDHYTLSETHLDTAKELVNTLPVGAELDIVCHSRGAAVIRGMLEHPDVAPLFAAKKITVGKVIFVAGANGGTPLAHMGNWKVLINVLSYLASLMSAGAAAIIANAIAALLKIVIDMASELDSLTMLDPASQFYADIKLVKNSPAQEYMYARADYDLSNISSALALALNAIMQDVNDLVIPWDLAGQFYARPAGGAPSPIIEYDTGKVSQTVVYHTDFFIQLSMWNALIKEL